MKSFFYSVLFSVLFPHLALAEHPLEPLSELDFDELMELEITSVSKKSEKLSEAAAAVYVVTDDEIRRSGATNIPEALRLVPGVDVAQIDANKWAVSIRGFNSRFANKLLVLIDGRSVYTPTFSGVYWEYFDYLMPDIARIEVIRGPGATLWGTNAVNGIINIITREAGENPGGMVSLSAGNEYKGIGLRQGGEVSERVQLRAYVKGKSLDEPQNLDGEDQNNGGDYLQTGFRMDIQPNDQQSLTLQGDLYRNDLKQDLQLPIFAPPYSEFVTDDIEAKGGNAGVRWSMLTGLDSEVTARFNYDFYDHHDIRYSENRNTFDIELQHQLSPFKNHELIYGGGYRISKNDFTSAQFVAMTNSNVDNEIWNLFIQDNISFPELNVTLTIGAKLESNNYTGAEIQPNIRGAWVPNEQVTWWAAISRANRTPARADTDSKVFTAINTDPLAPLPIATNVYGDEDFQSEQLDAYEMGVRWKLLPQLSIDIATFYNDYKSLRSSSTGVIDFSTVPTTGTLLLPITLGNTIQGDSKGLEFLMNWQATSATRFRLVYNFLEIELEDTLNDAASSSIISLDEDRALEHQISLWGAFDLSKTVELDLRLYYSAERSWEEQKIDAIVNGDLRIGWQATPQLTLSLVGRNLLHSAEQEFISESWETPSAIERSAFLNGTLRW